MAKQIEVRIVDGGSVVYEGKEYAAGDTLKVTPDEEVAAVLLQNGHFIDVKEEAKRLAEQKAAEAQEAEIVSEDEKKTKKKDAEAK